MPSQTRYASQLAERREVARIERLANFGLALGWCLALLGGFCWFCVISRLDWLWSSMLVIGLALIAIAVLLPDLLDLPCRFWMKLAHLQGWLVMTVLLSVIYFTLITPIGWLRRRRFGTGPFYSWTDGTVPSISSGWEKLPQRQTAPHDSTKSQSRSLLSLLFSTISFFYGRGHFFLLPVLILMLVLGVILFFVQGSVLAPFIYTIF